MYRRPPKRVIFRADASVLIGMGHVTRCLTLANTLALDGTESIFLLRSHGAVFARNVEAAGHRVWLLDDAAGANPDADWLTSTWEYDAGQTLDTLSKIGNVDWLAVDHYSLDARWERVMRGQVSRILAIDDTADRPHDCDLLLDQNLAIDMDARYTDLVPSNCRQLLGPGFALLRPDFATLRRTLRKRDGEVRRILICFGGSDPSNETAKALAAIERLKTHKLEVAIVIGMSNPNAGELEAKCQKLPWARVHRSASNMAELMEWADLAFGAGGVMSWERCCLGLSTIATHIAENQVGALTALAACGAVDYLGAASTVGVEQMMLSLCEFLDDPIRTRAMSEVALNLVDGAGSSRVRAAML